MDFFCTYYHIAWLFSYLSIYLFFFYFSFLKIYILLIMLLQLSHFLNLYSPPPGIPPPIIIPSPYFMSMGHTYKFFGFYISHTILNLPLSIFYLPFMILIPCTFSPILSPPTDNPPQNLYFCESVPVLVVCSVHFVLVLLG